jgi:hypothetical protein
MNGRGKQRLANFVSRKLFLLQQQNTMALQGHKRCHCGSSWSSTDDDQVKVRIGIVIQQVSGHLSFNVSTRMDSAFTHRYVHLCVKTRRDDEYSPFGGSFSWVEEDPLRISISRIIFETRVSTLSIKGIKLQSRGSNSAEDVHQ